MLALLPAEFAYAGQMLVDAFEFTVLDVGHLGVFDPQRVESRFCDNWRIHDSNSLRKLQLVAALVVQVD